MMKSPITRMGGKSKLRKTIIEMITVHIYLLPPENHINSLGEDLYN
nr:hypothetical protein [Clostridium botulinum]